MDRETFGKSMALLQRYLNYKIDDDLQEMYFRSLGGYVDLKRAFADIVNVFKPTSACPFPVIANFTEILESYKKKEPRNTFVPPCDESELPDVEFISHFMQNLRKTLSNKLK